jgi:hypothetical protein
LGGGLQIKVGVEYRVGVWRRVMRMYRILKVSNKRQLKEMGVKQF